MKSIINRIEIQTVHETEMINITGKVNELVENSGVKNGTVFVLSLHTTTGITVNEGLLDLEIDITHMIQDLIPDEKPYRHSRFLTGKWR
jgi:secondary thiamine-phosphate synthase enzyme